MCTMGLVLAGGKSSRMGQDKADLLWNGKTLLQCQIEKLAHLVGEENIFVSGHRPEKKSIPDAFSDRGPIEGLKTVLTAISPENKYTKALVIPVDMPLLTIGLLEDLMKAGGPQDVIKFKDFQLPALFQNLKKIKSVLWTMEYELLNHGDSSAYSYSNLYRKTDVAEIITNQPDKMINTNTNDEWSYALSKTNTAE